MRANGSARTRRARRTTAAAALVLCLSGALIAEQLGCRATGGGGGTGPGDPTSFVAPRTQGMDTFATMRSKRVVKAALEYPKPTVDPVQQVPMSLTGSDGTGLRLVDLKAKAVVQGPLAFTELQLTFHNPEDRQREGRFSITLPPGAAVSRLAMKLPDGWQEAEVVERQRARQIYEDFLHRKQDPALMEKKAGNEFRARIFPIPPRANKEIIISYSQKLPRKDRAYRLHLKGLPEIASLEITALIGEEKRGGQASSLGGVTVSHKMVRVSKQGWAPDRDFEVKPETSLGGLRHGNLALARVAPTISSKPAPMSSAMVLVDTSASRAAGFYGQVEQLGALVHHLRQEYGDQLRLLVACYDQSVGTVFEGPIGDFDRQHLDLILARRPLGASNLHAALRWAGKTRGYRRLILVTDGIVTAGKTDGRQLREAVRSLSAEVHRLDVVLAGGIRDEALARKLVTGTLERDGVVLDGARGAAELADRLAKRTVSKIAVSVPGARWVWPRQIDGAQPGDEFLVFADLPEGALAAGKPMTVALGGPLSEKRQAQLAAVKRPLIERAWVEARIAHLEHQRDAGQLDPDMTAAVRKQIIELSIKHRVLSDYTALLVLESERDYARYGIQRTALADILVVGATGVEVQQRAKPVVRIRPRPPVIREPPPRPRPRRRTARPSSRRRARRSSRDFDLSDPFEVASKRAPARMKASAPRPTADGALVTSNAPAPPPEPQREAAREERPLVARPSAAPDAEPPQARPGRRGPRPAPAKKLDQGPPPLSGKLAKIVELIGEGKVEQALIDALRWRAEQPGNVMALIALGEAVMAQGRPQLAARVYGSVIDLFPSRADMRRFAGNRLEALGKAGLDLAVDTYRQAVKQRPDHQSSHRMLAFALLRTGAYDEALATLEAGLKQRYRIARRGTDRIMREDLGLVAAALVAKEANRRAEIAKRLAKQGAKIADRPSLRFVLSWETDANDVDFHIHDGQGGHASYRSKQLPSGGVLFADVTNGYGPECFAIDGEAKAFPYLLRAHYYSRGPMGYGMGKIQVVQHDGKGGLRFDERPFVVMNDRAYVEIGEVKGPL